MSAFCGTKLLCCVVTLVLLLAVLIPVLTIDKNVRDEVERVVRPSRQNQVVEYLSSRGVSSHASLTRAGSPQQLAAKWIADEDAFFFQMPDTETTKNNRFIERYALAVLYYSTDGPNWADHLNFLEPIDHCGWYQTFFTSSAQIFRLGVNGCTASASTDLLVQRLYIRKYYNLWPVAGCRFFFSSQILIPTVSYTHLTLPTKA